MGDQNKVELRIKLARLEIEHSDLSHAVDALIKTSGDPLCIQRLKKKKLTLKDQINKLHMITTPDIIA